MMGETHRMLIQTLFGKGKRGRTSEWRASLKRRREGKEVTNHTGSAVKAIPGREKVCAQAVQGTEKNSGTDGTQ